MTFKYSTQKAIELTGAGRMVLHRLRFGESKKYKDIVYDYPAILVENQDYEYRRANVFYSDSAIEKIKNYKKGKQNNY